MAAVVVLLDHRDPRWRSSAAALLDAAHRTGVQQGWPVHAVWVGPGHDAEVASWVADTSCSQPVVQHVVAVQGAEPQLPESLGRALQVVAQELAAGLVLVPSTFEGREVAARLAALTRSGVVVGASAVAVEGGRVVATKTVLAGSWRTRCAVTSPLAVVALDAHAATRGALLEQRADAVVELRHRTVQVPAAVEVLVRAARPVSERPSLAEAEVVVVGGRGTGGNFSGVEDLADALGGAVGATRVATDEGWAPHALQVGQTGVTISPRLYVGAGVSGAVHHRGGMAASATVVAVNSDPDAPIFDFADVAVVADAGALLPELAAEVRARRAGRSG